jgi:hypothetical protein
MLRIVPPFFLVSGSGDRMATGVARALHHSACAAVALVNMVNACYGIASGIHCLVIVQALMIHPQAQRMVFFAKVPIVIGWPLAPFDLSQPGAGY